MFKVWTLKLLKADHSFNPVSTQCSPPTYLKDRAPYPLSVDMTLKCGLGGAKTFDVDTGPT